MIYTVITLLIIVVINTIIKQGSWYRQRYEDVLKFKSKRLKLEVINIGSNASKFSFDYSKVKKVGMNCAVGPETLNYDYQVLKFIIPHIVKNGVVFMIICPFSSISETFYHKDAENKYYLFLDDNQIMNFSLQKKVFSCVRFYFPIIEVAINPRVIKPMLLNKSPQSALDNNPFTEEQLKADAQRWMNGWSREFSLDCIDRPLSPEHKAILEKNVETIVKMVDLCREHDVKPILVLHSTSHYLSEKFTSSIKERYIYDFVSQIKSKREVTVADYMDNEEFQSPDLYYNSFFLNKRGREIFTKDIIEKYIN